MMRLAGAPLDGAVGGKLARHVASILHFDVSKIPAAPPTPSPTRDRLLILGKSIVIA